MSSVVNSILENNSCCDIDSNNIGIAMSCIFLNRKYKHLLNIDRDLLQMYFDNSYCLENIKIILNICDWVDIKYHLMRSYENQNTELYEAIKPYIDQKFSLINPKFANELNADVNPQQILEMIGMGIGELEEIFLRSCKLLFIDFIKNSLSYINFDILIAGLRIICESDHEIYNIITAEEIVAIIINFLYSRWNLEEFNRSLNFSYCKYPGILRIIGTGIFYNHKLQLIESLKQKDYCNVEVLISITDPIELNFEDIEKYLIQMPNCLLKKFCKHYILTCVASDSFIKKIHKYIVAADEWEVL